MSSEDNVSKPKLAAKEEIEKKNEKPTPIEELLPGMTQEDMTALRKVPAGTSWDLGTDHFYTTFSDTFFELQLPRTFIESDTFKGKVANLEEGLAPIRKRMGGRVVIDIGCGESPGGYLIAEASGARAYIGVDLYASERLRQALESKAAEDASGNKIPWNVVPQDGLTFLRALKEGSVSVIMSGISEGIIPDKRVLKILKEVVRVVGDDGGLLSIESSMRAVRGMHKEAVFTRDPADQTSRESAVVFVRDKKRG